ncbi:hypothetical protein JNO54_02640 [Janibacter sp. YIM B02568]|uniref:sunset domain-containing protein n=1 Tax=Janibacter endophyticus TaxID=2806261 RepID=UPI0019509C2C|nr:hypothetical protein [Janibacter endophyticus]MBM6545038.1 hypothetical protein [Janibacter endophyticus]
MTEHDEQDVTRTGATAASTQERYDDGMRTDDDQSVDPQEEVEERLKGIEEERRAERDDDVPTSRADAGGDDEDRDDTPADSRAGDPADGEGDVAGDADAPPSSVADRDDDEDDPRVETDEEKRAREEAFAAEHDPEQHDLSKGEEFRQAGDWTAEDGKLTEDDVADSAAGSDEQGVDGRRLSSVEEIRDGGYGVGSAAPIEDGAMPLDHSVKAWEDTKTYLVQGEDGYDGVDPHVWFLDDRSAERAGFDHAG